MKNFKYIGLALFFFINTMNAQSIISLDDCYRWQSENHPLTAQISAINKSEKWQVQQFSRQNWPQATLNGQVSWQSDVSHIPNLPFPGFVIESPTKDQYKLNLDIAQNIYDGGMIKASKKTVQQSIALEAKQVEANLYAIKEQLCRAYFGGLLAQEQVQILKYSLADLNLKKDKVEKLVKEGVAIASQALVLDANIIEIQQQIDDAEIKKKNALLFIESVTGKTLADDAKLINPIGLPQYDKTINRPETQLLSLDMANQENIYQLNISKNFPKVALFGQVGYGRPGLNFLSNQFDPYAIVGMRLNWNLAGMYLGSFKRERAIKDLKLDKIKALSTSVNNAYKVRADQEKNDAERMKKVIESDNELIRIRTQLVKIAETQFQQGIINSNDYTIESNALLKAQILRAVHDIQYQQSLAIYKLIIGQ